MKFFTSIALVLLTLNFAFGQGKINGEKVVELSEINIKTKLPFSHIRFIDERFDTTKMGYRKTALLNEFKKLVTHETLSQSCQNHINKQLADLLDSTRGENLLIVIKKLWLQQITRDELNDNKLSITRGSSGEGFGMCASMFDVYIQKDSIYFPLLKIDTILYTSKELIKDYDDLLTHSLENCVNKIASYNLQKLKNRKGISWQNIAEYNNK